MKKLRKNQVLKAMETSAKLREMLLTDPDRPGYHFATPEDNGYPGDCNMAFYANGRYHLMYLYRNYSDYFRLGHMSSIDLLHWRLHGDAVAPDNLDGGIFSGGAFVDDDGTAYIAYWALPVKDDKNSVGGIRIAYSTDIKNHYTKWQKFEKLAISATNEPGITEKVLPDGSIEYLGCADPSNIWKVGDTYYMQLGNILVLNKFRNDENAPKKYKGDWTELYSSKNMTEWKYEGRFYQRDITNKWTDESEDDMCPSFLPLPLSKDGGNASGKYLQLFIAHNKGCQYYVGEYDPKNTKTPFIPQKHGRMSWQDISFFAPEALVDNNGRQIMWAWLRDNKLEDDNECVEHGWSGVFSLPRTLWLNENGELGIAPIKELENLRYGKTNDISNLTQNSCEINIKATVNSNSKVGLKINLSKQEYAEIFYDAKNNRIVFDATNTADKFDTGKVDYAPLSLSPNEKLNLTFFIDRSVIEVFANDKQAMCRRIYSDKKSDVSLSLISNVENDIELIGWNIMETNLF